MADIKLRIEVNPNAESEFLGSITNNNARVSNTSININTINQFVDIPVNEFDGSNGIVWNTDFINENGKEDTYIVFNDNDELDNVENTQAYLESEENPDEFFWGIVPANKEYSVRLTFTEATNLKDIIVFGDKVNNQFPTEAIVDGTTTIYSDDYKWAINLGSESDTHTIEFTKWNRANYNACITLIRVQLRYFEIDKISGLKSVESLSQTTDTPDGLFYGSIENSGNIEILDRSGELEDLLTDGVIDNSNVPITVIANVKNIQHHISSDSVYNKNSKILNVDLRNRLNSLDILKYKGYDYPDHSERLSVLLFDVLSNLRYSLFGKDKELTEEEFREMLSDKYDSTKTLYDYLYSVEVKYPVIETNKTYREVIDKFCIVAQMQMYIDDENNVKFVSARPVCFKENLSAIHIPKKNMFSQLDYSVILKNKYDGVETTISKVNDLIDYNSVINNNDASISFYSYETSDSYSAYNALYGVGGKIESFYSEGNYSFPIKTSNNLKQVLSLNIDKNSLDEEGFYQINTQNEEKPYNVTYDKFYGQFSNSSQALADIESNIFQTTNYSNNVTFNNESDSSETGKIATSYKMFVYQTLSVPDDSYIKVRVSGDIVDVKYKVLSQMVVYEISTNRYNNFREDTIIYKQKANSVNVSIYGDFRTISFEGVTSSTSGIESAKTKVSISESSFVQNEEDANIIKKNILADYISGVSNGTVNVSCSDYYNQNGEKVIEWSKGEIFKVNQIVYFDNDLYKDRSQRYWRITGRNFRYSGVPMLDLELQEVKIID